MYFGRSNSQLNSLWRRIQKEKQNCAENHSFFFKIHFNGSYGTNNLSVVCEILCKPVKEIKKNRLKGERIGICYRPNSARSESVKARLELNKSTFNELSNDLEFHWQKSGFLVACYATLHPALSVHLLIHRSVRHTLLFWRL